MAFSRQDLITFCVVGFISWTIIGGLLPGLRYLPYAFVFGILAAVVGIVLLIGLSSQRPVNAGHIAPSRPTYLSFTAPQTWQGEIQDLKQRSTYQPRQIYAASAAISGRINGLLKLVLRDFLTSWYSKISSSDGFTNEVDRAIRVALRGIISRAQSKDLVELGVIKILPIINAHIKDFSDAERLVRGRNLSIDVTETEELDLAIATKYREGRLHPAASLSALRNAATQQQHMRRVIGRLVAEILPQSMTTSASVLVLIREILACAVIVPVLQMLSDPDMINQLIENYGRSVMYERKTVRKLRAALDEHATPVKAVGKHPGISQLSPDDSERTFERFIRSIRQINSLPDARRSRSELLTQMKRGMEEHANDGTYLRRLEIGRKILDQTIASLLKSRPSQNGSFSDQSGVNVKGSGRENASLRTVLYDASGLSYFMEFMDRKQIMSYVQFWVVVDGMRSPLDVDNDGSQQPRTWSQADRKDIMLISDAYMAKPELGIPRATQTTVRNFIAAGSRASWEQYSAARKAIFVAQDGLYKEMEKHHFQDFKHSDLYYKWITSDAPGLPAEVAANIQEKDLRPRLLDTRKSSDMTSLPRFKEGDLRRTVASASASDLRKAAKDSDRPVEGRRSLDGGRPPLFDDEHYDTDPLTQSTQSLESETDTVQQNEQDRTQIVAAVQAALDDIVDESTDKDSMFSSRDLVNSQELESPQGSFAFPDSGTVSPATSTQDRPSLASLGLIGTPTKPTVFTKGDLFGESEKLWEEDGEATDASQPQDDDDIHEAAPGDLGLAELVQSLSVDIDKLEAQQSIVDALTRKAELTNNAAELRILRKSKVSLEREIRRKEMQRQQYIVQQSENDLYGRATISIKKIIIGTEEDGHEFALYVIEVQRHAGEKAPAVAWAVAKRYSEFHDLHKRLRIRYPSVRELEFPRRQMVLTLQKEFLRKRRAALERYLRELLTRPNVCRSIEFRAFLSQQAIRPISANGDERKVDRQDFITRIYNSVTDGMEEFLGNMPVLDQLSLAGQNLISAATALPAQAQSGSTLLPGLIANDPATAADAEAEMSAFESTRHPETTTFIKPICDIFIDLFELHQGNAWFRGRAVVVVIQQLLGGTIERKVRDTFKSATSEDSVIRTIDMLKDMLWPGGKFRTSPPVRTQAEKARSKRDAGLVLATLVPDFAGGVVGKSNAAKAGRTLWAMVNNERLNQHLVYTVLDEVIEDVFGVSVRAERL